MSEDKNKPAEPAPASGDSPTAELSKAFFKSDKIEDPNQVRKLMLEAAERVSNAVIWIAGQKEHIKTRIPHEIGRDQIVHFSIPSLIPASFEIEPLQELLKTQQLEFMIRIYLPGAAILGVKSKLLAATEEGYQFEMPKTAIYMQRRKHRRFTIPGAYEMSVDVPHPKSPRMMLSKKLIDVSVEGISFLITKSEEVFFKPGRMLPNLEIQIRGRGLKVGAEVKNIRDFKGPGGASGVQVGAKIFQISEKDADYLTAFVEEMLIQYSRSDHTDARFKKEK